MMGTIGDYDAGWNYDYIAKLIEDWKKSGKSREDYFQRPILHRRPTNYDRYWEFLRNGNVNLDRWGEMDEEKREMELDFFYGQRKHDAGTLYHHALALMERRKARAEAEREASIPKIQFEAFKKQYGLTKWDPRIGNMYRRARKAMLDAKSPRGPWSPPKPLPTYMRLDPDVLRLMFEEEAIREKAQSQTPESSPEQGQFIGPGRVERAERRRGDDLQVDSGRFWQDQQQSGYSGPGRAVRVERRRGDDLQVEPSRFWQGQQQPGYSGPGNYVQPTYQGGSIHQPSIQEDPYAVEATRPMTPIGQGRRQQPILGRRGW